MQVWDDPKLDGRAHVFGASKIFEGVLRDLARKRKPVSPFLRFLYNTWLYLDVLSSLSSGEDPFCLKLHSLLSALSPPTSPVSVGSPLGNFSLQGEIDSLLGCAEELFPLIARMSAASNRLFDKVITQAELPYIADAIQIRDELREWKPPERSVLQESSDVHCSLDDIICTAEVYRLTALLHLFRAFPPLGKDSQALADQILNSLLLIPVDSGSLCIHIWPLMAAGCEHTDPVKRHLVLQRFEILRERLMIGNVDKAIELLIEVWKRKDAGDVNAGWANLAKERGWLLLLG
jgi:Fungal specific transcription factor domain